MRHYRDRQRSVVQLAQHLETWGGELGAWETGNRRPVSGWLVTTPEGETRSISIGEPWPNRHGIHRFRSGEIAAPGAFGELRLDFTGEALVRLVGRDGKALMSFSANPQHKRFRPLPSEPFRIEAEVAARTLFGHPNRNPSLALAEIVDVEPSVRDLRRRVQVARATMLAVADEGLARSLYEVVEIALSGLRLPTRTAEVGPRLARLKWAEGIWERSFEPADNPPPLPPEALETVDDAIEAIDAGLAELRERYPKQGKVLVTGHAHIDYAWLWPQPETVRKINRTFHSMNTLMDSHPEFTFLQSSSIFYRHTEEDDPRLLEAIKARVAEGRWEVIGGMYIECDTNLPSAEAFVRQFLHGQRDFRRWFGAINRTAWLPDTFGFTAAMPQIMRHTGIETLVTIKVTWNETNGLPDNLFDWQGNDGSRVLVHTFNAQKNHGYNMYMTPAALMEVWGNHLGKDLTDTVIASYGWGDGGGGPDPDQIEEMPVLNLMPAIPSVHHGSIQKHIDAIRSELEGAALPSWVGELYLEYHRATLTSQARTKQLNRRAEYGLVAAEALGVLANLAGDTGAPPELAADWALLLRNQFHDILPGSSIREVYEQTEPELAGIVARAEARAREKLATIAGRRSGRGGTRGVVLANLSGSAKPHWQVESGVELPASLKPQKVGEGWVAASDRALAPLSVAFAAEAATGSVSARPTGLENALVKVTLDAHGRIARLFDKRVGRELIEGAGNRLMVYRNDLPRTYDAWDIEPGFALGGEELTDFESLEVTAQGPHLGEITIVRKLGASTISQRLRLWSNSARLDIVTDIDWHDRRTYVRAAFPVTVLAGQAVYDQGIGVTHRATHDNTSWEKAQFEGSAHRFASLGETDWGAALISADKYGFSVKGNVMTLSLVRGPSYPDMLADEGRHHFTYAILPHDGRWWSEEVQAEADLVNDPLRFLVAEAGTAWDFQPVKWQGQQMRFHALKPLEDGHGTLLRVSEAAGRRGAIAFSGPNGAVSALDGLERPSTESVDEVRPFRLMSVKI